MARQRKKHHFWRNLLILIVLFGIYLYWGNRSIETDEATFTSGALPAGFDGCRIVQLSDLHGKYFGKGNERLYSAVKAAHPEYIFVTGDLVDRQDREPDHLRRRGRRGALGHRTDVLRHGQPRVGPRHKGRGGDQAHTAGERRDGALQRVYVSCAQR